MSDATVIRCASCRRLATRVAHVQLADGDLFGVHLCESHYAAHVDRFGSHPSTCACGGSGWVPTDDAKTVRD